MKQPSCSPQSFYYSIKSKDNLKFLRLIQSSSLEGRVGGMVFSRKKRLDTCPVSEANSVQSLGSVPTGISLQAARPAAESYADTSCLLCSLENIGHSLLS